MKTALFKEILALLKTLGIKVDIGMRTNIEKIPSMQSLANTMLSKTRMKKEIDRVGLEKVISIFKEEARYLPALNDKEAGQFLQNTKKLKELIKPDEATVIPFVGKTDEAAVSGQVKRGTKIWEALGLDPTKDADMGQYLKFLIECRNKVLISTTLEMLSSLLEAMYGVRRWKKSLQEELAPCSRNKSQISRMLDH